MFVRIRGKGACPENSQAAIMHIRGFRHTHSAAPPDCFFPLLTTFPSSSSGAPSSSTDAASAAAAAVEMRPFRFAVFPIGIHAAALTAAQAKFMSAKTEGESGTAPASAMAVLDGEVARMVWKETWNLYDILYDEVPLLPWSEAAEDAVAATVEDELRRLAEAKGNTALTALTEMAEKTDDFVLASTRVGNRQVVVCPHYYAAAAMPGETFTHIQREPHTTSVALRGPVLVLDLRDVPAAQAGAKAMVHVAWYTAFAAMQPDSVLLRCRAVVVRLPYRAVPTYAHARANAAAPASATMADAFVEMVDFMAEHITAVRHAMLRELGSTAPQLAQTYAQAPPVVVVGSAPEELRACMQAVAGEAPADVVVFYGDHIGQSDRTADFQAMGEACVTVEAVQVPLKALLDGGEEEWDAYTLRERARLNFCPCCGDCGTTGGEEESHGHGHGHGHGHH